MPKNPNIRKVLVIGSGPIVIGQAAEFDYAGTQACRVLKEEGVEVVLVNSNPATIMTDTSIADKVYLEPLTVGSLEKIIAREHPDSLLAVSGRPDRPEPGDGAGRKGDSAKVQRAASGHEDRLHPPRRRPRGFQEHDARHRRAVHRLGDRPRRAGVRGFCQRIRLPGHCAPGLHARRHRRRHCGG